MPLNKETKPPKNGEVKKKRTCWQTLKHQDKKLEKFALKIENLQKQKGRINKWAKKKPIFMT